MAEKALKRIDWILVFFILPIISFGLVTMRSFVPEENAGSFFNKQIIWVLLSFTVFFIFSFIDFRFLKQTNILVALFLFFCLVLLVLFILGTVSNGAQSWFDFGGFSFQPADMMKLVLVIILAKYFSRRHVEIKDIKHIFISGFYALVPFVLVLLQPDFGSAMIIFFIWFGMVLVSGISKKHLLLVFGAGVIIFTLMWMFVFADYQKARISNFLNPLADIHGSLHI
jgi:rod shape determining protein RodA